MSLLYTIITTIRWLRKNRSHYSILWFYWRKWVEFDIDVFLYIKMIFLCRRKTPTEWKSKVSLLERTISSRWFSSITKPRVMEEKSVKIRFSCSIFPSIPCKVKFMRSYKNSLIEWTFNPFTTWGLLSRSYNVLI